MASSSSGSSKSEQQHSEKLEAAQQMHNDDDDDDDDYSSKQMKHIAFVVIGIVGIMSVAMVMIWAVVKPKRPIYAIEYGLISEATLPSNLESLVGNFRFVMRSYNPNTKATIYYGSMKILSRNSSNDKSVVWSGKNFSQPPFNVTRISFLLFAQVEKKPGYEDIIQHIQHGNVSSNISVRAEIRYGIANWKSSPLRVGIYCRPANVMLGHNFQPADCYVDL